MELMSKFKKELTEKQLYKLQHHCVICKKQIMVMCGTPVINYGGCCIGYQTPKKRVMMTRKAHIHCFIENLKKE